MWLCQTILKFWKIKQLTEHTSRPPPFPLVHLILEYISRIAHKFQKFKLLKPNNFPAARARWHFVAWLNTHAHTHRLSRTYPAWGGKTFWYENITRGKRIFQKENNHSPPGQNLCVIRGDLRHRRSAMAIGVKFVNFSVIYCPLWQCDERAENSLEICGFFFCSVFRWRCEVIKARMVRAFRNLMELNRCQSELSALIRWWGYGILQTFPRYEA